MRWAPLSALAFGLALALGLCELGLRAADALGWVSNRQEVQTAREASIWRSSSVRGLHYVHREGYVKDGVRVTEAHGILAPEDISFVKSPGTLRIALIGDSVSAALNLSYPEHFAGDLERSLSTPRHPTRVLNFAVNGYSTRQETLLLETRVAAFEPDLLLVQYCMNDLHPSETPLRWFRPLSPSYLVAWSRDRVERWSSLGYPPAAHWERAYREDTEGWAQVTQSLARMGDWAKSREMPALLAIVPVLSLEGWRAGDASHRHAMVTDAGRNAGFSVLDLLPVLEAHPLGALRVAPWDTFHLNAEGQRLVAEALVQRLRKMAWPRSRGGH